MKLNSIILYFFLIPTFLFSDNRLRLKKADILESKVINGEKIQFISGNVTFQKGTLTLDCEKGKYIEKKEIAYLYNEVVTTQEGRTLTCDTLIFNSKLDMLTSHGNPHVWDNDYDLTSDSLVFYTEIDSGIAVGNVHLNQKGQIITANRIEYVKGPNEDGVFYKAIGHVTIEDSTQIASCGLAIYDRTNEKTTLKVKPVIKEGKRILSGSEITLSYSNEILENIDIPKQAHAQTITTGWTKIGPDSLKKKRPTKYSDDMTGNQLRGFFTEGYLDSLRLEGMATTLYHVFEDSIYQGKNLASGDTITMLFADSTLDRIVIVGGSEGTYAPDSSASDISDPVSYHANIIDYNVITEEMDLIGKASILNEETHLEAGFINVSWTTNLLTALPVQSGDTLATPFQPVINEKGQDPMEGDILTYNLKSRKGKAIKGKTKADDGFYTGNEIRNETKEVFYIQNSTYTTCDLIVPHFHFKSKQMKVINGDKVIARPIILNIGKIPVFGLPLGVFPHKGGARHSGWIMPSFGEHRGRGQHFDGLGYYWAPNDFWGSKFTLSFGDRQGIVFRADNQYNVRYKYSGNLFVENRQFLSGSTDIIDLPSNRSSSFKVRWKHKQVMRKEQTFNANLSYSSSGNYNREYGLNQATRMDQYAVSNASYTKRWPKSGNSLSLNVSSKQDLMVNEKVDPSSTFYQEPTRAGTQLNIINNTLPKMSFRHGQSALIPAKGKISKWYNNIKWNYSANYTNKSRFYYESVKTDSVGLYEWAKMDSIELESFNDIDDAWNHSMTINAPQKIFKYISISPSLNLRSAWVNQTFVGEYDSSGVIQKKEIPGFATRTTGSFSMNGNTKIYGLFPIPIGPVKAIRHIATPSVGFSFTPDFSKPLFGKNLGYFDTLLDSSSGSEQLFDRFGGTMAGNTPKSESKSMNFSLNNSFQAKVNNGEDEKKVDLLTWRMSSSYNFSADSLNLSNLRSSIRSKIAGKLNLDLTLTHDFYEYNTLTNQRINSLNTNQSGLPSPRMINARFSTSFRFSGKRWTDQYEEVELELDTSQVETEMDESYLKNPLNDIKKSLKGGKLWNSSVSLSYAYNVANPNNTVKTFWVNSRSTIQITKEWRFSYNARFDLINKSLVSHTLSVYRDIHCWELSLNWTPSGIGQSIYFILNVKSPTLRDIKVEKTGGRRARSPF